jgi:hypothetical protein
MQHLHNFPSSTPPNKAYRSTTPPFWQRDGNCMEGHGSKMEATSAKHNFIGITMRFNYLEVVMKIWRVGNEFS